MTVATQEEVFAEWLQDHQGIVVKVARTFASGADFDDLVQEIMLQLWRSVSAFRGDSKVSTWVYRVALNRALTWQRSEDRPTAAKRLVELPDLAAPDRSSSATQLEQVYELLRSMPEIDRSLILLSLEGMTYAEMADLTGMTATNVGARLSRARKHLTKQLEEFA